MNNRQDIPTDSGSPVQQHSGEPTPDPDGIDIEDITQAQWTVYTAQPGCLPDTDDPARFTSYIDARNYYIEEAGSIADSIYIDASYEKGLQGQGLQGLAIRIVSDIQDESIEAGSDEVERSVDIGSGSTLYLSRIEA